MFFFLLRDVIKRIDQSEFEGFEYINPLLLSTEETVWGRNMTEWFCRLAHDSMFAAEEFKFWLCDYSKQEWTKVPATLHILQCLIPQTCLFISDSSKVVLEAKTQQTGEILHLWKPSSLKCIQIVFLLPIILSTDLCCFLCLHSYPETLVTAHGSIWELDLTCTSCIRCF